MFFVVVSPVFCFHFVSIKSETKETTKLINAADVFVFFVKQIDFIKARIVKFLPSSAPPCCPTTVFIHWHSSSKFIELQKLYIREANADSKLILSTGSKSVE